MNDYSRKIAELLAESELDPEQGVPDGLNDDMIGKLEEDLGLRIPAPYRMLLKTSNCPCVGGGGLVGISQDHSALDFESIYQAYPALRMKNWLPLANDGSGNYFVAVLDENSSGSIPVAFVDLSDDPETLAYVVASKIEIFLEHFILSQSDSNLWPFDKNYVFGVDPDLRNTLIAPLPWV